MPNELCFAIYYKVPDRAFERAAATWVAQECGNRPVLTEVVATEADFKRAWDAVALRARTANARVVLGQVFSHSSKGGDSTGLEFKPGGGDDGTLTQAEIQSLPVLPWAAGGRLILSGCNSGLTGTRGWAPAGAFAKRQGVPTVGMAGYGYFSTDKDKYVEIKPADTTIYLWAYKRGKNDSYVGNLFGSGGRMAGVEFQP